MNEVDLKLSSNEKILGINIDENLVLEWSLSIHIKENNVQDPVVSNHFYQLFYNAYIRPHLEYCSVIWGNSTNINIQKMTKLQRRDSKLIIILGDEYTHLDEARDNLFSFDEIVFLNNCNLPGTVFP